MYANILCCIQPIHIAYRLPMHIVDPYSQCLLVYSYGCRWINGFLSRSYRTISCGAAFREAKPHCA